MAFYSNNKIGYTDSGSDTNPFQNKTKKQQVAEQWKPITPAVPTYTIRDEYGNSATMTEAKMKYNGYSEEKIQKIRDSQTKASPAPEFTIYDDYGRSATMTEAKWLNKMGFSAEQASELRGILSQPSAPVTSYQTMRTNQPTQPAIGVPIYADEGNIRYDKGYAYAVQAKSIAYGDSDLYTAVRGLDASEEKRLQMQDYLTNNILALSKQERDKLLADIDRLGAEEQRVLQTLSSYQIDPAILREFARYQNNYEDTMQIRQMLAETSPEHPVLTSAASVLMAPAAGVSFLSQEAQSFANLFRRKENKRLIDAYNDAHLALHARTATRDSIADDLMEKHGQGAARLYQGGMALLDSAVYTVMGKGAGSAALTTLLNSTATAGEIFVRQIENGASQKAALNRASIVFAIDAASDTWVVKKIFGSWSGQGLNGLVKSAVSQGAQDAAIEALTAFADVALNGRESELIQARDLYVESGMTVQDATRKVLMDEGGEIFSALLTGAATGSMQYAVNNALDFLAEKKMVQTLKGEIIRTSGQKESLLQAALSLESNSAAHNLARRITERQDDSLMQLGMDTEYLSGLSPIALQEAIENVAKETGATAEELGKLDELLRNEVTELTAAGKDGTLKPEVTAYFKSRNMRLENQAHPVTGVPFERVTIQSGGEWGEVVAAKFKSFADVILPEELYPKSNRTQFKYCNQQLYQSIMNHDTSLSAYSFSEEQLDMLKDGITPPDFTWHHDVSAGHMQLVDKDIHEKTGHTGGRKFWGGSVGK